MTLAGTPMTMERGGIFMPLGHHRARGNDTAVAYHYVIQHYGVHADDAVVLDGRPMQDSAVPAGDIVSYMHRSVQDTAVLDAREIPHHDLAAVRPQDGVIPDAGVSADPHIADELASFRQKGCR